MDDDPLLHGELDRVAARLDAEVRAENADYERMAVQSHRRGRDLAAVAREWMVHGDTVAVAVGGEQLTGRIHHVAGDLLVLRTARGDADVNLAAAPVLRRVEVDPDGVGIPVRGPSSFLARMRELEQAQVVVTVLLTGGATVRGGLLAAADDHLLLEERGVEVAMPLHRVAVVRPG